MKEAKEKALREFDPEFLESTDARISFGQGFDAGILAERGRVTKLLNDLYPDGNCYHKELFPQEKGEE